MAFRNDGGSHNHVKLICATEDVQVDKIIPKSKRDYSYFIIRVLESQIERIKSVSSGSVNAQFIEWFRKS